MKRFAALLLLSFVALFPCRGEGDPLKNVFHSLSRLRDGVRNIFIEDSDDQPSPTPRRHRRSGAKHSQLKRSAHEHSSEASTDSSGDAPKPAAAEEKPDSDRSPAPATDEGAGSDSKSNSETAAPMATLKPEALREFSEQPAEVQGLIRSSLALTEQNLSYKYGSADPAAGGMDCSGFIYYVLSNAGYKDVPRDSAGQYEWVRKSSDFRAVLSRSGESFELNDLRPGDLLFWSGTYKVDREIPITHVMIYLGKEKSTDKPVMVGSTDGRSYNGVRRYGVSVFDFKMPTGQPNREDPGLTAKFEGYASIPRLRGSDVASKTQVDPAPPAQSGAEKNGGEKPSAKANPTPASWGDGD
jgi:cell wall-associated NlpC family hydrolase